MNTQKFYPIGDVGQPWRAAERALWRSSLQKKRSYINDVVKKIDLLRSRFEVFEYGTIDYPPEHHRLYALKSHDWRQELPTVLVTGGVHGYETSGVHGALAFLESKAGDYKNQINLLVAPCVSPWAYEFIHRWNADAIDPNRSFHDNNTTAESAALIKLIAPLKDRILLHIDLHETTDSDESEFRPALAARDGKAFEPAEIPDGFYTVGDTENPQLAFQQAVITGVSKVTHIAPPDSKGQIIGSELVAPGVILYAFKQLGLCAGMTNARFTTTTEVYPDSPRANPDICNLAQVAAVKAAIEFALSASKV